jgi:GGDEF domain-containing protein
MAARDRLLSDVAYRRGSGCAHTTRSIASGQRDLDPGPRCRSYRCSSRPKRSADDGQGRRFGIAVSARCGVTATVEGEPDDFSAVSACADRALYKAKKGRNVMTEESGRVERFGVLARWAS